MFIGQPLSLPERQFLKSAIYKALFDSRRGIRITFLLVMFKFFTITNHSNVTEKGGIMRNKVVNVLESRKLCVLKDTCL